MQECGATLLAAVEALTVPDCCMTTVLPLTTWTAGTTRLVFSLVISNQRFS